MSEMGGMEAGDFEGPSGFHSKPPWQRILILAGARRPNFLVAMLLIGGIRLTQVNTDPGKVLPGLGRLARRGSGDAAGGTAFRAVTASPSPAGADPERGEGGARSSAHTHGVHSDGRPFTMWSRRYATAREAAASE